ncbi:MAG: alpha/beta hydrolase [Jatrophihabitans sp.]|uniref:alpha/beta hydrolase n=1 Tax=Jatrophihabitans sp. TaxID=1932789 RepID=UPI00390D4664
MMTEEPALEVREPTGAVRGVVLVLHGGRANGTTPVRARQLAVLRMAPFARSLRRTGAEEGLAVARLRYVVRGWNGASRSPVPDVEWALDQLANRFPDVPTALVGHSMGGRAAIYAAAHPSVHAVVGLAPWIEAGDPYAQLAGRHLLVAHGDGDRITNGSASAAWTRRAATVAASASYVSVRGDGHAMLKRASLWHSLTTSYVLEKLCGTVPDDAGSPAAAVMSQVLAGQTPLVV